MAMIMIKSNPPRIGVDLAKISRFDHQQPLAIKILSAEEFHHYQTHAQPATYLAGRFAGKEAFIKAYQPSPLPDLPTIEVLNHPDGAPFIRYNNQIYSVSISHDGEYVVAMVIIL
jgi:phosphopantetheine--protein transferase-like protein